MQWLIGSGLNSFDIDIGYPADILKVSGVVSTNRLLDLNTV